MIRFFILVYLIIWSNSLFGQQINLKIYGESEPSTEIIDSIGYTSSFLNYKTLEAEVLNLKKKLTKQGYIDCKINEIVKKNDSLFLSYIYIGVKINTVRVFFNNKVDVKLLNTLDVKINSDSFDVAISELESTLNTLNKYITEEGDPFSTLQLTNVRKENVNLISGDLRITKNQKRKIDNIVVKGYEEFPKSYIKHLLKLKKGQVFSLEEIKSKTQRLETIRFAKSIKPPEVLFTNDSTTLYLYAEKTKNNTFDGFIGFGSNEQTNKLDFDGYLDLRLINNLNFGETLKLFYKSDEIDQQTINISANAPFIFGAPIGLDFGLHIFRKDSTFSTTTQYAKLNYQANTNHTISSGIRNSSSSNLLDTNTLFLNDYNTTYFEATYNYIKPQYYDQLFPINFWFNLTYNFGNRDQESIKQSQNAYTFETYKILNLNNRNSFFVRLTGATLMSDNYLDNELYRFGGINSIRGFEENSLTANLYGVINTEYRYKLNNSIYIHSVIDAAYLENEITDTKNKLFGFGFGFGLLTKTGLFRLNYTGGKTDNQSFRFSDSKIHLSLSAVF